jgi:hypothetical protein
MELTETRRRYALFGTHGSIDEARAAAIPIFGDIFKLRDSDYCDSYWLGYWHGEPYSGDQVRIRPNREWEGLYEDDYPEFETLLYVAGSNPTVEEAISSQGFAPLQITESHFDQLPGERETFIRRDIIFDANVPE